MFTSGLLGGWGTDEKPLDESEAKSDQPSTAGEGPAFSFWTVAAAVTSTVRKQATELVNTVTETDWKSEISAFGKEVSHDTQVLGSNAIHMVDHIPGLIETLPEQAERALPSMTASGDMGHTLDLVGSSITQFGRSLLVGGKELIEQVKDAVETEIAAAAKGNKRSGRGQRQQAGGAATATPPRYSRFDAEVSAMQRDSGTYCDEPEDKEEYSRWRGSFNLASAQPEISRITGENPFMAELQSRIVPLIVEHDDFWHRYFYRLHRLQQKEEQRQQLAQMAKSMPSDDELAWDDLDEAVDKVLAEVQSASSDAASDLQSLASSQDPDFDVGEGDEEAEFIAPVRPAEASATAAAAASSQRSGVDEDFSAAAPAVTEHSATAGSTVVDEASNTLEETSSKATDTLRKATGAAAKTDADSGDAAAAAASPALLAAAVAAAAAASASAESVSSSGSTEGISADVDTAAVDAADADAPHKEALGDSSAAPQKSPEGDDAGSNSSGKTEWSLVSGNVTASPTPTSELSRSVLPAAANQPADGVGKADAAASVPGSVSKAVVVKTDDDDDDDEDEDFDDADLEDLPPGDGDEEVDEDWGNWD